MKTMITAEELHALLEQGGTPTLIDALPGEYFESCHIPGALNICVYEMTFLERVSATVNDPAAPLVVYGASARCHSAAVAREKLNRAGYGDVRQLAGGLEAWQAAGLPVERSSVTDLAQPLLSDGLYVIDVAASRLEWIGRNLNNRHFGTINLSGGEIRVEQGRISAGQVVLAMDSIANLDIADEGYRRMLISHLSSEDFFDVARYPTAFYRIAGSEPLAGAFPGSANFLVKGNLELKGVERDQNFAAEIAPQENGQVKVAAAFDIDRTRWGVLYGSGRFFECLGMHLVSDTISIELFLVAAKG